MEKNSSFHAHSCTSFNFLYCTIIFSVLQYLFCTIFSENFFKFLLTTLPVGNYVKDNCNQEHTTLYYILPGIADTHDGHTHVDNTKKKCTNDNTRNGATSAVRRCAADETGTDGIHLKGSTSGTVYRTDTCQAEESAETGQKTHVCISLSPSKIRFWLVSTRSSSISTNT